MLSLHARSFEVYNSNSPDEIFAILKVSAQDEITLRFATEHVSANQLRDMAVLLETAETLLLDGISPDIIDLDSITEELHKEYLENEHSREDELNVQYIREFMKAFKEGEDNEK